ncbi:MAG: hypothetical protein KGY67_07750 [Candidatus Thermoplasmatota archaeon]|nr:hypothetical protein [Candidatus Thermoplasmatota archaeon]
MENKNHNESKIKKKIKEYKKRLNNLKLQGFTFSKRIYDDIDELERKVKQPTIINQLWEKKLPMIAGIAGILFIAITFGILFPNLLGIDIEKYQIEPMKLTVNELVNGTTINTSINITGKAENLNGLISSVNVKIDDHAWETVTGSDEWKYNLNIFELNEGKHTLCFRCSDGENFDYVNKTIFIKFDKPTIIIHNPDENVRLSEIMQINGTSLAANGIVQYVEIRFDQGKWNSVTGTKSWSYNFDTKNLKNGNHTLEARCKDNMTFSNISLIHITIFNENEIDMPPFEGGQYFQLYFPPSNELIEPNITYKLKGYHRARKVDDIFFSQFPTKTTLEIQSKPNWLTISLPEETLITQTNNETFSFSINIEITEDAPMNRVIPFTIRYKYGKIDPSILQKGLFYTEDLYDVFIFTGQWKPVEL